MLISGKTIEDTILFAWEHRKRKIDWKNCIRDGCN